MIKRQKYKIDYRLTTFFIIGVLLTGMIAIGIILQQKNQEPPIFAESGDCTGDSERDNQGCQFGGDPRNDCDWICPGNIIPACCDNLAKTGDPFACCFDARRRCTLDQCSAIPEGVQKQRCGQLWELGGYCPHGSSPTQTSQPTLPPPTATVFIASPTSTPIPAPTEVSQPTLPPQPTLPVQSKVKPTQIVEPPKERPQITYIPIIVPPYTLPTLTPTPTPFKFNLPNILPPKEKVQSFWEGIRLNLVNFFSKILP